MSAKIPVEFWKTPKKDFEPCCGKENAALVIFDKFYFIKDWKVRYPMTLKDVV